MVSEKAEEIYENKLFLIVYLLLEQKMSTLFDVALPSNTEREGHSPQPRREKGLWFCWQLKGET